MTVMPRAHDLSYGQMVRDALQMSPRKKSMREVARDVGYSHEYIRKVLSGTPPGSREFNDTLARYLGLDPEQMWRVASLEKARRRFGPEIAHAARHPVTQPLVEIAGRLDAPSRSRLTMLAQTWESLSTEDQQRILDMARSWAHGRRRGDPGLQALMEADGRTRNAHLINTAAKTKLKVSPKKR